jgi:hypothetical protein
MMSHHPTGLWGGIDAVGAKSEVLLLAAGSGGQTQRIQWALRLQDGQTMVWQPGLSVCSDPTQGRQHVVQHGGCTFVDE